MARSIGKPEANPPGSRGPDLKGEVPTLDEVMRRPQIPKGWEILPPPTAPDNPFGPVPIMPPPAPTWPYGPPYLGGAPALTPLLGVPSNEFGSPQNSIGAGGLPGMMQRSRAVVSLDPQDPPAGGLVKLLQEYLRSHRESND